jgi:hypothetical protein
VYKHHGKDHANGKKKQSEGESITWDEIIEILIGELRFTPEEVGWFELKDVVSAITGHTNKVTREMRQEWEVARWINLNIALPYTKKGLKNMIYVAKVDVLLQKDKDFLFLQEA